MVAVFVIHMKDVGYVVRILENPSGWVNLISLPEPQFSATNEAWIVWYGLCNGSVPTYNRTDHCFVILKLASLHMIFYVDSKCFHGLVLKQCQASAASLAPCSEQHESTSQHRIHTSAPPVASASKVDESAGASILLVHFLLQIVDYTVIQVSCLQFPMGVFILFGIPFVWMILCGIAYVCYVESYSLVAWSCHALGCLLHGHDKDLNIIFGLLVSSPSNMTKVLGLGASCFNCLLYLILWTRLDNSVNFQFFESCSWLPSANIEFGNITHETYCWFADSPIALWQWPSIYRSQILVSVNQLQQHIKHHSSTFPILSILFTLATQ